eukprot:TRINITY_DN12655_c0_g2_i1.p1 TRINITY_DN12655_c0_g2~~TRINITY_DN12655_c0_g2_i1.p1  ORF type:complete len:479 (+),score=117.80 TRINITY_DN12655_c0_g2_i1:24-1439(+)
MAGQVTCSLGLVTLVLGATGAAIGAYNAQRLTRLQRKISGDPNALAENVESVKRETAAAYADLRMMGMMLGRTNKAAGHMRQEVLRSCEQLQRTLDEMATQLQDGGIVNQNEPGLTNLQFEMSMVSEQLDEMQIDKLRRALLKVQRRYKSCLLPLTKGELPHASDIEKLLDSAESLDTLALNSMLKLAKGDPARLPLYAGRAFAVRVEVDARNMRSLREGDSPLVQLDNYSKSLLRSLREDIKEEIQTLWQRCDGAIYPVTVVLAPLFAQYSILGRALTLALSSDPTVRLTDGTSVMVDTFGDEEIIWDDNMQDFRKIFQEKSDPMEVEDPLGERINLVSLSDCMWFVGWQGHTSDFPVKQMPDEIPTQALLKQLGIPPQRAKVLDQKDTKVLLQAVLPERLQKVQQLMERELSWATQLGARLELLKERPELPTLEDVKDNPWFEYDMAEADLDMDEFEDAEEWFDADEDV